jgi:hypothetical protein
MNVHPVQEMTTTGAFINRCPRNECGVPMPAAQVRNVVGDQVIEMSIGTEPALPLQSVGDSNYFPMAPTPQKPEPVSDKEFSDANADIAAMARNRLAKIEPQINSLQAEARRLRAMIAAVEALDAN